MIHFIQAVVTFIFLIVPKSQFKIKFNFKKIGDDVKDAHAIFIIFWMRKILDQQNVNNENYKWMNFNT